MRKINLADELIPARLHDSRGLGLWQDQIIHKGKVTTAMMANEAKEDTWLNYMELKKEGVKEIVISTLYRTLLDLQQYRSNNLPEQQEDETMEENTLQMAQWIQTATKIKGRINEILREVVQASKPNKIYVYKKEKVYTSDKITTAITPGYLVRYAYNTHTGKDEYQLVTIEEENKCIQMY